MKRLIYLLLAGLLSGCVAVGCASESSEDEGAEATETTDETDGDDSAEASDEDEDAESDSAKGDADYSDKTGNKEDNYAPADNEAWGDNNENDKTAKKTEGKADDKPEPVPEEEFNDDFEFDDNLDDVFDTSPDPDPSEFVKVDKSPTFLNEEEVRAAIKAPYNNASGKVYAKILVGLDGNYRTHYIRRSPDKALSKAVVEGMEMARFTPAKKEGEPVKVWVDFFYEFK